MVDRDGRAHISRARWIGERYDVELIHAGACPPEDILFWWVPPEPPPAELMRYADRVDASHL
jgi:hypothetical protein